MSQYLEGNHKAFPVGSAGIAQYLRVKFSAGLLVVAGVTDAELGVTTRLALGTTIVPNETVDVYLRTASGTTPMVAAVAGSKGDTLYTAASGKVGPSASNSALKVGIALEAYVAGGVVEVLRQAAES